MRFTPFFLGLLLVASAVTATALPYHTHDDLSVSVSVSVSPTRSPAIDSSPISSNSARPGPVVDRPEEGRDETKVPEEQREMDKAAKGEFSIHGNTRGLSTGELSRKTLKEAGRASHSAPSSLYSLDLDGLFREVLLKGANPRTSPLSYMKNLEVALSSSPSSVYFFNDRENSLPHEFLQDETLKAIYDRNRSKRDALEDAQRQIKNGQSVITITWQGRQAKFTASDAQILIDDSYRRINDYEKQFLHMAIIEGENKQNGLHTPIPTLREPTQGKLSVKPLDEGLLPHEIEPSKPFFADDNPNSFARLQFQSYANVVESHTQQNLLRLHDLLAADKATVDYIKKYRLKEPTTFLEGMELFARANNIDSSRDGGSIASQKMLSLLRSVNERWVASGKPKPVKLTPVSTEWITSAKRHVDPEGLQGFLKYTLNSDMAWVTPEQVAAQDPKMSHYLKDTLSAPPATNDELLALYATTRQIPAWQSQVATRGLSDLAKATRLKIPQTKEWIRGTLANEISTAVYDAQKNLAREEMKKSDPYGYNRYGKESDPPIPPSPSIFLVVERDPVLSAYVRDHHVDLTRTSLPALWIDAKGATSATSAAAEIARSLANTYKDLKRIADEDAKDSKENEVFRVIPLSQNIAALFGKFSGYGFKLSDVVDSHYVAMSQENYQDNMYEQMRIRSPEDAAKRLEKLSRDWVQSHPEQGKSIGQFEEQVLMEITNKFEQVKVQRELDAQRATEKAAKDQRELEMARAFRESEDRKFRAANPELFKPRPELNGLTIHDFWTDDYELITTWGAAGNSEPRTVADLMAAYDNVAFYRDMASVSRQNSTPSKWKPPPAVLTPGKGRDIMNLRMKWLSDKAPK